MWKSSGKAILEDVEISLRENKYSVALLFWNQARKLYFCSFQKELDQNILQFDVSFIG